MEEKNSEKHIVEAKINPQAIVDYYYNPDESGRSKGVKDIQMKAKQHLSAMGWSFFYIIKKGGKRELRYCPPNSKTKYISLRMACKGYLDRESQFEKTIDNNILESQLGKTTDDVLESQSVRETNVEVPKSKKRRLNFADVYGDRMLLCMKGKRDIEEEDDVSVQNSSSKQQDFAGFYIDLFGDVDVDDKYMNVATGLEKDSVNALFSSKGKDSKLANGAKKRKIGGKGRSGSKLALLIKSKLILPLSKVFYRRRDGSVLGEGRVTSEGIDCSCCHGVLTLTKFEAHVGSTYHRPAANIFVEDGRSLLQIEQQMVGVDKQVKGINKKAKGINNGSVSRIAQQNRNDNFCLVCGDTGELILCNQCPSAFHAHCLALSKVPASELWYCASCCCRICGQHIPRDDSEPNNKCDQCEQHYHVKCLGEYCAAEQERKKWFCSEKCKDISSGLGRLLRKTFVVGENNLSWTVLKNETNVIDTETTGKLNDALKVMHECFKSVRERHGTDVGADVIFSRPSELKRLDFRGFYTVILEKNDEVVTVATVRVFGDKVAEVPLVATRFKYRRLGMCKTLMDVLEEKLMNLGVEKLVLPAISSVVDTWTSPSFGFTEMTPYERSKLINYTFLNFPGTVTCQKLLAGSGESFRGWYSFFHG